jgi:AcrR family transcriptional regulator
MTESAVQPGRAAQRRRTRRAIVEAGSRLLASGAEPSIADIAAAADVSRRTVYMHFPTLDQLLLDATVGAMTTDVDDLISGFESDDVRQRVGLVIDGLCASIESMLPLGRKLIKLTVDTPPIQGAPKRGHRRVRWIEEAVEPVRRDLGPARFERLVSALAVVIGWEAFIVLFDARGLTFEQAQDTIRYTAGVILDAALAESRA